MFYKKKAEKFIDIPFTYPSLLYKVLFLKLLTHYLISIKSLEDILWVLGLDLFGNHFITMIILCF